jgi:hypothetical protein
MDTTNIRKKIQYITVDSEFVQGSNNTFTVNLGTITGSKTSNVLLQNLRNVIGLKVVDFYITQIASFQLGTDETSQTAIKYIDILCPDIPDAAQILDERKSKIFARVPLERDFSGTSNTVVNDKQWKSFDRLTNYFNPISIRQLNFQIFELTGSNTIGVSGTYQLLQPDASFYMILEVTTIDNDVITLPKEDPTVKVVEAIQSLEEKVVGLPEAMKSFEEKFTILFEQFPEALKSALPEPIPAPAPVVVSAEVPTPLPASIKMDKKMYWIIAIAILVIGYLLMNKK